MLYALLCYNDEKTVWSWSKAEEDACMARLGAVQEGLATAGKLGPVARLMPTTTATTLGRTRTRRWSSTARSPRPRSSFWGSTSSIAPTSRRRSEVAKELGKANPGGSYEIRPLAVFNPVQTRVDQSCEAPPGG